MFEAIASCKFCNKSDLKSIQMICEKKCLICFRCQQMGGIRKLLTDQSYEKDNAVNKEILGGSCPICGSSFTRGMSNLIRSFKESIFRNSVKNENTLGRIDFNTDLEDSLNEVGVFLRRFRSSYETTDDNKIEGLPPISDNNNSLSPMKKRIVMDTQKVTVPVASVFGVMEFMAESYSSLWQSNLKNGNESLSSAMIRIGNRKKFVQKTNDIRIKSLLDFLSSNQAVETYEIFLYGILIGLQPKIKHQISTAWSQIALLIILSSIFDNYLKEESSDENVDVNPHPLEFKVKFLKLLKKPAFNSTTPKPKFDPPTISGQKSIKILESMIKSRNPYFMMSPLSASCVEFGCSLPWERESISKILNISIFAMIYLHKQIGLTDTVPTTANSKSSNNNLDMMSVTSNEQDEVFISPRPIEVPIVIESNSPLRQTRESIRIEPSSNDSQTSSRSNMTRGKSQGKINFVDFENGRVASSKSSRKVVNIFKIISNISNKESWERPVNNSFPLNNNEEVLEYLSDLDKQSRFIGLSFESAIKLVNNLNIPTSLFIFICINCWQEEYESIKGLLSKGSVTSLRRNAISGVYDSSNAKLTAVERLAMTRLLHWYDCVVGNKDIDWDDLEYNYAHRNFPFEVPASLMNKSKVELNYLSQYVLDYIKEMEQKNKVDDRIISSQIRSENFLSADDIQRSARNEYGPSSNNNFQDNKRPYENYEIRNDVEYTDEDERIDRIMDNAVQAFMTERSTRIISAGVNRTVISRPTSAALSTIAYASPNPVNHSVYMVDILDTDKNILTNVGLLNTSRPVTPHQRNNNNNNNNKELYASGIAISDFEKGIKEMEILENETMRKTNRTNAHSVSDPFLMPNSKKILGNSYSELVERHKVSTANAARNRVLTRMGIHADEGIFESDTELLNNNIIKEALNSVPEIKYNYIQILDIKDFLDKSGELTIDLSTHATIEYPIKILSFKNSKVSINSFEKIADNYLRQFQLSKLVKIDLTGNKLLGLRGSTIISNKLQMTCNLVHLTLNGMDIGDMGMKKILRSMIASGGNKYLLRLDMQSNGISIATEAFSLLSNFYHLRALDLAHNNFTLDTTRQCDIFISGISTLENLQSLSVAYSKIQEDGFKLICYSIKHYLKAIKIVDVAGCFLTSKCINDLMEILRLKLDTGKSAIDEIMIQDNLFTEFQLHDLESHYNNDSLKCKVSMKHPHLGIEYPLRYEPRDYGINIYPK